jgi:hypothetical protein
MTAYRLFAALPIVAMGYAPARAQLEGFGPSPLFSSHDVIEMTLVANLEELMADVDEDRSEHAALLSYRAPDGSIRSHGIKAQTRGRYRRNPENCPFPPLRLNFDRSDVAETLFDVQDKLKLVTHCRTDDLHYDQFVLQEYGLYRVFNVLTPRSFRVRLVRMTYLDVSGRHEPITRNAFLIEHIDDLARRVEGKVYEEQNVPRERLDFDQLTLLYLFEYMIGNIDWDVSMLQNLALIAPSRDGPYSPIPYDFDLADVIAPPGADRHPRLGPTALRHLLFADFCRAKDDLEPYLDLFKRKKEDIYAVFDRIPGLTPERAAATRRYFDQLYRIINSPRNVEREFLRPCRVKP